MPDDHEAPHGNPQKTKGNSPNAETNGNRPFQPERIRAEKRRYHWSRSFLFLSPVSGIARPAEGPHRLAHSECRASFPDLSPWRGMSSRMLGLRYMPEFESLGTDWWTPVLCTVVASHRTKFCVTLFLHRALADQHLCRRRSTTQQSLRRPALRQVLASDLRVRHRLDVYHAAVIHWTLRSAVRPRRCPRPRLGVNAWLM